MALALSPDGARRVLLALGARGGEFAEIFLERSAGTALLLEGGRIEEAATGCDRGAGLRLVREGRTHFTSGNDVTEEGLLRLADNLVDALPAGTPLGVPELVLQEVARVSPVRVDPAQVPVERKIELLHKAERAAREHDALIAEVAVRYRDQERHILVANSEGLLTLDRQVYTSFSVSAVAREGRGVRSATRVASGTCGFELFESENPEALAREAARVACAQLRAAPAPPGTFTVVLSSRAGGTMVHEACGHGLEADFVEKGFSVYAGKLGQRVASERITVVDDATLPGKRGSYGMDDEGFPGQRTVLVERGILRGLLHSRETARRMGQRPTGNGRRESYRHLPLPRMSNTLILPGDDDPEAILASVEDGIFVAEMGGGEVDIVSGNFVFHCTEAYRIRNGRIAEPVRDAILTGNGPEVLSRIDRVGSDLGFQVGTCGKEGQGVPVADAQPTLRIPGIVVGGRRS